MKRIFISVSNDLATDQRVQRVCSLLVEQGHEVLCTGRLLPGSLPFHPEGYRARRMRMLFRKGPLFYACLNVRLFFKHVFAGRPSLFIANDLDTLLAVYLASRIRRVPVLYDSHELFTEVPELVGRSRTQAIWLRIEGWILPRLRQAITVSPSIAAYYEEKYGTPFSLVRNVPFSRKATPGKEERRSRTLIYQGALNLGRGLDLLIRTMERLKGWKLIIAGKGDVEEELKVQVEESGLGDRVNFLGPVHPDKLRGITASASVGLSLEEDLGLNYRYALPNKLFDYIQAGIPVICSDLPEMRAVVEQYGIGKVLKERDAEVLAALLEELEHERSSGNWTEGLEKAARELCWEEEQKKYLAVFDTCIQGEKRSI